VALIGVIKIDGPDRELSLHQMELIIMLKLHWPNKTGSALLSWYKNTWSMEGMFPLFNKN